MSENTQNLKALEAQLNSLRSELDSQIVLVQKRSRLMIIVFGILFIAMCGYLTFAYKEIAKFDAPMVLATLQKPALSAVDEALAAKINELKSDAPRNIQVIEGQILRAPSEISSYLQEVIVSKLSDNLPRLESELNDKIDAAIIAAKTKAQEQNLDLKKPEDFKKFLDMVTDQAFSEMQTVMDKLHAEYLAIAGKTVDYLDHLAAGENLSKREQHHRGLLITFMMVHQKGIDPKDPAHGVELIPEKK